MFLSAALFDLRGQRSALLTRPGRHMCRPPELVRREVELRLEAPDKIAHILEAAAQRNIGDAEGGVHQQVLGVRQAALRDVLHGAHADRVT